MDERRETVHTRIRLMVLINPFIRPFVFFHIFKLFKFVTYISHELVVPTKINLRTQIWSIVYQNQATGVFTVWFVQFSISLILKH